jgi:hypothetical protein
MLATVAAPLVSAQRQRSARKGNGQRARATVSAQE